MLSSRLCAKLFPTQILTVFTIDLQGRYLFAILPPYLTDKERVRVAEEILLENLNLDLADGKAYALNYYAVVLILFRVFFS